MRDFDWHRVAGERFQKSLAFTSDEHIATRTAIFCSLWSAMRYWCTWLIETTHVHSCSDYPLLDLLTPRFSPSVRILQYLRSLTVSDPQDRFFLVHTLTGCSRADFVRSHPLSKQMRSGVIAMSAWMWWRCEKYMRPPIHHFQIVGLPNHGERAHAHCTDDIQ